MDNVFFNAHHSPVGAYSTFTLGSYGGKGGFGLESGRPSNQNIYIGMGNKSENKYEAFPFYNVDTKSSTSLIQPFDSKKISREYNIGTDIWKADNLTFSIYTPHYGIPNPEMSTDYELKKMVIPAIFAEIIVDNSDNNESKEVFFGFTMDYPNCGLRHFCDTTNSKLQGIANGRTWVVATDSNNVSSVIDYRMDKVLSKDYKYDNTFCSGNVGGLLMEVAANKKESFRLAICFFKEGIVTSGIEAKYYYTKFYNNLEDVALYAVSNFDEYVKDSIRRSEEFTGTSLSQEQKFQICHSIKSYYGNTQLLECNGDPLWVVNEGEYRFMNTLDLMVDQLFYELRMNPWTVKNVLEMFVKRYSYMDKVSFPHENTLYPGGRGFTHDMGLANNFSRSGYSSYEKSGIEGCFSYMTCEQLVNWILCASVYTSYTNDSSFLSKHLGVFKECLESLLNRDHPNPSKRNGLMSLESSRTAGGVEITTYDSLDASIGQARNSAYLGVKIWAAYLALENILKDNNMCELSGKAHAQARLCADTICNQMNSEGYIPGILFENNTSKVIPIIEGLIYPYYSNNKEAISEDGEFGYLIKTLKKHLNNVLVNGNCLFDDGGWKLSSSSINSWLSKIYLCQFIARKILGMQWGENGIASDKAHVRWLLNPEYSNWCFCDQIFDGTIKDSKYYPRGVTSILWTEE